MHNEIISQFNLWSFHLLEFRFTVAKVCYPSHARCHYQIGREAGREGMSVMLILFTQIRLWGQSSNQ